MIYEIRRYDAMPGKMKALHELMRDLAVPVFKRLGMTVVACTTPMVGTDENALIYILGYADMGERQRMWDQFWVDSEWVEQRAVLAAKFGGPVVAKSDSFIVKPTDYSPLQ